MKHSYFLLSAALCMGVTFGSQADNMSLSLKGRIASLRDGNAREVAASDMRIPVIVSVSDPACASELEQLGLSVAERFGGILMGSAPIGAVGKIASHPQVLIVDEPTEVFANLNLVKPEVTVDKLHETVIGLEGVNGITTDHIPFTGKGVILGVGDTGIQPSHVAFYNDDRTELRIKRYIVTESGSENGKKEVTAKIYDDPAKILRAESKPFNNGHGTHVSGIAGGSYPTEEYRGMAPGADLVLSNLGETMYADEIMYTIKQVMEYADEHEQPVVLNLSLGSIQGSHNGKGAMANAINSIVGEGKIICVAAGNDGMYNMSLARNFSQKPLEVKTCIVRATNPTVPAQVASLAVMSENEATFEVAFAVVDKNTSTEVYTTDFIPVESIKETSYSYVFDQFNNSLGLFPEMGQYIAGNLKLYGGITAATGQYGVVIAGQFQNIDSSKPVYPAIKIRSAVGANVLMISNNTNAAFSDCGVSGYISGTPDNTIADYATTERAISVGAINGRETWTTLEGVEGKLDQAYYGKIMAPAAYSSYGVSFNAEAKTLPLVLAPGTMVISAYNGRAYNLEARRCVKNEFDGNEYYWGLMTGSSMATPAVSGIIALWLEAYPKLTPEIVKEVIQATADRSELIEAQPYRCATGLIDAYEGLKYIYKKYVTVSSVENVDATPSEVMVRYLSGRNVECVIPSADKSAEVALYDLQGRCIDKFQASGTFNVDMPGAGCYLLSVSTNGKIYTQRLLAK